RALPGMGIYASTKAAMHAFTQALRVEAKPCGVHVVEILPMSVRTPFFKNALNRSAGAYESGSFITTPEQIAQRILKAIRRPVPEIYTSTLARIVLALDAFSPRLFDAILFAQRRKSRAQKQDSQVTATSCAPDLAT